MPQAVRCRLVTAEVWVRQGGQSTQDLRGTGFSPCTSALLCQCHSASALCAYRGKSAKAGKLKQSGTVPDIRKGRECWKRKYFVIVPRPPDGYSRNILILNKLACSTYSTNIVPQLIRKLVCGLFYPFSIVIINFPTVYNFSGRDTQYTLHTKLNFTFGDSFGCACCPIVSKYP